VLVPGENRLAFGVPDAQNNSVYGKTAVNAGLPSTTSPPWPPHSA